MVVFIQIEAEIIKQRLTYVLDFLNHHPLNGARVIFTLEDGLDPDKTIVYGKNKEDHSFFVPAQESLFKNESGKINNLVINRYYYEEFEVHSVEAEKYEKWQAFFHNHCFSFDLFETIFFHISRFEEVFADQAELDSMGMVPQSHLLLQRANLEQIPVVDQLVGVILTVLGLPQENRPTDFVLSHDIDKIYKYNSLKDGLKAFGWPLVYQRDLQAGLRNVKAYFRVRKGQQQDPYDSYSFLFSESTKWNEKVIYFMAGGQSRYDLFNKYYDRDILTIYEKALDAGYSIGLHPSFHSVDDEAIWAEERSWLEQKLNTDIHYSRQHFLHFYADRTPALLENMQIEKDSTLGYTRTIGFRCGTGFEHRLYDFANEKPYHFVECPLILMDSSLLHQVKGDPVAFHKQLHTFLENNKFGTRITMNFHNSTFDYTLTNRWELNPVYLELKSKIEKNSQ